MASLVSYAAFKAACPVNERVYWSAVGEDVAIYMALDGAVFVAYVTASDRLDFEASLKVAENETDTPEDAQLHAYDASLPPKELDGRLNFRPAVASYGHLFHLRSFSFYTADPTKLSNRKWDNSDWGDVSYVMLDVGGGVTADPALAAMTIVDFEAQYAHEVIGGWVDIPPDLHAGTTDEWWLSVVGAPDVPEQYGGSIEFVNKTNLEAVISSRLNTDGRATAVISYDPKTHAGRFRFSFWHPLGVSKRFQISLETYK